MHRILLTGVRGRDQSPGDFRRLQVGIGTGGRFIPPPHQHLLDYLHPLEKYLRLESSSFDPLVDCFLAHYQFETIHPFNDGNGRVVRLLLAIMFQHKCKLTKPWLYMSNFFNWHREEYVQLLFNVSAKNDGANWIQFCLRGTIRGTIEQAKATETKCNQLRQIKDDYMQRLQNISRATRLIQIVDRIFESPFLRITDLPNLLGVSGPTARLDAERLVEASILRELPGSRPKVYYAPEMFDIAYGTRE